jgi:uncharacterized protein (TIGR03118 family)
MSCVFGQGPRAARQTCRFQPAPERLNDRCLPSGGFGIVNLASNEPGLARFTDPYLADPWGIAASPTGPFWFADNASGVSDILDGRGAPFSLIVALPAQPPSANTPAGIVFNAGNGFLVSENGIARPSRFLIATRNGTIDGWSAIVDPNRMLAAVVNESIGADYTGLALGTNAAGQSFLYAADFGRGTIDVFDQNFRPPAWAGAFLDPSLPAGYAPFNIQNVDGRLFVTYAMQDGDRTDDITGAGHGVIDVYDTRGTLLARFASGGALNSPWGLAVAPPGFGPVGGALLVGNNGDGRINAYNLATGTYIGAVLDDHGTPLAVPYLWSLSFGNGHMGGDAQTLFFTAGLSDASDGLFGAIQAPGRLGADTAGLAPFDQNAPGEPGDYPLPPRAGPRLVAGSDDSFTTVSALLPLSGSSLVLVPTLSPGLEPNTQIRTPISSSLAFGTVAAVGTFGAPVRVATNADFRVVRDATLVSTALDVPIDSDMLRLAGAVPRGPDVGEALDAIPVLTVEPALVSFSDPPRRALSIRALAERPGSGAMRPVPREDELATRVSQPRRGGPAAERAPEDEPSAPLDRRIEARLRGPLPVIGVAIVGSCWLIRRVQKASRSQFLFPAASACSLEPVAARISGSARAFG